MATCSICGRVLASGAKCVYCGQGTEIRKREELQIPEGTLPPRKEPFPWGRVVWIVILIVAGIVAYKAGLVAKVISLIRD